MGTTKTVVWDENRLPEFPIYDAKKLALKQRLEDQAALEIEHQAMRMPVVATSDDEEAESGSEREEDEAEAEEAEEELEPQEEEVETPVEEPKAEIPPDFFNYFQLSGWFRRLPLCDPSSLRPPNAGSRRPFDVHPQMWSSIGQCPQARELACRSAEKRGEQPPELSEEVVRILLEDPRVAVTEALLRAADIDASIVKLRLTEITSPVKAKLDANK